MLFFDMAIGYFMMYAVFLTRPVLFLPGPCALKEIRANYFARKAMPFQGRKPDPYPWEDIERRFHGLPEQIERGTVTET